MNQPQLQPPGAGLPPVEAWVSRKVVFPLFCRLTSWGRAEATFLSEGRRALELVRQFGPADQERRILIPRLPGLEDSSRYWSPFMVLEHLVIVGTQIREMIVTLSQGRQPEGEASTAAVKPSGGAGLGEFETFLEGFWAEVHGRIGDEYAGGRFVHPWFGGLTLQEWQRLLAMHQGIHRRQLERMLLASRRM